MTITAMLGGDFKKEAGGGVLDAKRATKLIQLVTIRLLLVFVEIYKTAKSLLSVEGL